MATELLLCEVNHGWHKAGSAAGFALLEAASRPKEGKILDLRCSGVRLVRCEGVRKQLCIQILVQSELALSS